jgi:hypothetical protein
MCVLRIFLAILLASATAVAAEFHVTPEGTPQGSGSLESPWDLATALAGPEQVKPGDTVWLHGGTYRGGFHSRLTGETERPIVVRGAPHERVTIDTQPRDDRDNGLLLLGGADAIYRDFEVTCSHPQRITKIAGSWPADIRRGSVDIRGDRIKVVNLVVHDQAGGFGFWSEGEGGEISGCLIYNNGWTGPDRNHGHGIYVQNARGVKRMADNLVFHQFAYGIHAYGSDKASLRGLEIEGNICFHNGIFGNGSAPGIMVGGGTPAGGLAVRENVVVAGNIRLGYPWGVANDDAIVADNYIDGSLVLRDFRRGLVRGNTIAAGSNVAQLEGEEKLLTAGLDWDENNYFLLDGRWGECAVVEHGKSRGLTFEQWKTLTGFDARSTFTKGPPPDERVIIRPNAYDPGRANIAVLNPAGKEEVEIDLSEVLQAGKSFRIVSAKDFYGKSLVEGTFSGKPVRIPMKPIAAPLPIGIEEADLPQTEPHFAAFVVLPGER